VNRSHYRVTFQHPYPQVGESVVAEFRRLNGAINEFDWYVDNAVTHLKQHAHPDDNVSVDYQVCTPHNQFGTTCKIHEIGDAPRDVIRQAYVTIYGPGVYLTYTYQVRVAGSRSLRDDPLTGMVR
jgi:hypothetical protein